MKILVPVDGSNASIKAVNKAIEIARKYNYSIKLISVVKSIDYRRSEKLWSDVDSSIILENEELNKSFENKSKENFERLLNAIIMKLDFNGIKVEKEVLVGEPYEVITSIAKNENFDFIIMGSRGFSKIKRFFVGSVTQRVISEAPCPVLVIRSDFDD